jgi:Fic family protein
MDVSSFTNPLGEARQTPQGHLAFFPAPLPRRIELDEDLVLLLSQADRHLGELAGLARMLPNPQLLIAPLSQREAVLSSRIEGTQASVSDLAIFEADQSDLPAGDVLEVRNYRSAMNLGLQSDLPLSLRLVRNLHERLMRDVRGQEKNPGEFRTTQNWIGAPGCSLPEATYVPPPPEALLDMLSDWEHFIYAEDKIPPVIKCAMMHYHFEALHPFLDGNGRVGRLLITLYFVNMRHLPSPVLYLSPFFERHRSTYYDLLRGVSERSDWNAWLAFFLQCVIAQCKDALIRSRRLTDLFEESRKALLEAKAPPSAQRLLDLLFLSPATTLSDARQRLGVTSMSASRAIDVLVTTGILEEVTGRKRDRVYVARGLVNAIEDDSSIEEELSRQSSLL